MLQALLKDTAVLVPRRCKRCKQLLHLLASACLHGDIDDRVAEIDAVVRAIVQRIDDVGAMLPR